VCVCTHARARARERENVDIKARQAADNAAMAEAVAEVSALRAQNGKTRLLHQRLMDLQVSAHAAEHEKVKGEWSEMYSRKIPRIGTNFRSTCSRPCSCANSSRLHLQ
jgi:hypothetical protein